MAGKNVNFLERRHSSEYCKHHSVQFSKHIYVWNVFTHDILLLFALKNAKLQISHVGMAAIITMENWISKTVLDCSNER